MRHYLFLLLLLFTCRYSFAQTTVADSLVHNSLVRTYSFYVPASYIPGQPVPLVIDLHGFGSDGPTHAQRSNFQAIADTANFIVAHPNGTRETITQQRFWNYGAPLVSSVDDVGFLEALIDTISADYSINQNRIYCSGMSNGTFMSYYVACQSNRFAAVGGVTGSMSVPMYNSCNPVRPTPTIHVHGTSDNVNPYTGTSSMQGIESVAVFWAVQNSCDTTPVITQLADTDPNDGATAERYVYNNGVNGHTVELFKVTGGGHTWPGHYVFTFNGNTCMDFDATAELWRFFSQYEITVGVIENRNDIELSILPNPSDGVFQLQAGDRSITTVAVFDMQGRVVETFVGDNIQYMDLRHLQSGNYVARISGNDFFVVKKLVITSAN
ncbi:MAG TPA: PHB depolymerase family esterase [Bacteroidia bacterium]|nr:PHB depolymerase family esterase [Bacteroidia bacterium]